MHKLLLAATTASTLLAICAAGSAQAAVPAHIDPNGAYDCYAASWGDEICGTLTVPANTRIFGQVITSDGNKDIKFTAKSADGRADYGNCSASPGHSCPIWKNDSGAPVTIQITTHSGAWTHGGRTTGQFSFGL